jgi:hypothetical protein
MKSLTVVVASLLLSSGVLAQAKTQQKKTGDPDRLGLTCAQILATSSADWVAKFTKEKGAAADETSRAIAAFGKCYEARTGQLARMLSEKGKGPSMAARKEFANFDQALKDFTALALAATNPPADPAKTAYAALYEKQFRYEFYLGFEPKPIQSTPPDKTKPPPPAATPQQTAPASQSAPPKTVMEADPITKAKNHFGELLGVLPEDKIHEVHAAFGKIFVSRPLSGETKLAVYRYAIYILEPPSGQPFSPPPF